MKQLLFCLAAGFSICCLASAAPFSPGDSFEPSLGRKTPAVKVYAAPAPVKVAMQWETMSESLSLVPMALKFAVMSEPQGVDPVDQPDETLFSNPVDPTDSEAAILNEAVPAVGDFVAMIGMLLPESELLAEIRLNSAAQTAAAPSGSASSAMLALARLSR